MSKMIQLRNVPDALHRSLKVRAAMAGMSLSDYLLAEIKEIAGRPMLAELRERLNVGLLKGDFNVVVNAYQAGIPELADVL